MGYSTPSEPFRSLADLAAELAHVSRRIASQLAPLEGKNGTPESIMETLQYRASELMEDAAITLLRLELLSTQAGGLRELNSDEMEWVYGQLEKESYMVYDPAVWQIGLLGRVEVHPKSTLNRKLRPGAVQALLDDNSAGDVETGDEPRETALVLFADVDKGDPRWERLLEAAHDVVSSLGYRSPQLVEETEGSVFRIESWKRWASKKAVRERIAKAEYALELAAITQRQAEVDATQLRAMAEFVKAMADVPRLAFRSQGMLIVKYPGPSGESVILSRVLTPLEIQALEKYPEIQKSPENLFGALALAIESMEESPDQGLERGA
jgi:hypothetical protein